MVGGASTSDPVVVGENVSIVDPEEVGANVLIADPEEVGANVFIADGSGVGEMGGGVGGAIGASELGTTLNVFCSSLPN